MFFNAGGNGKNIRIENNVFRREAHFLPEQIVGALADFCFARESVSLTLFIKRHHDSRRAIALAQRRLPQELSLAFLHADRVDDGLALHALQPCLYHVPFGRIDHHRHTRNIRFACQQIQKARHGGF